MRRIIYIGRAQTPKNEVFSSQDLMLPSERACSNKPKLFEFFKYLIFKEVMAIFVPAKSPNIWQPILGPAQAFK